MSAGSRSQSFDARPFGQLAAAISGAKFDRKTRARLGRGDSPRSGQPVWRNSYYVGQIEDRIWRPINDGSKRGGRRWTAALLKAAEGFEKRTLAERREKEPGARNGALGRVALDVLKYLYEVVDFATGRLDPALRTIADETLHSYSAVHRAIVRLRKHGFLEWMRRSEPVQNPEPGGPLIRQASNAYALLVPEKIRGWLASLVKQNRVPACEEERRRRKKQEFEAMLSGLSRVEYQNQPFNEGAIFGPTLKRIAAALEAQEAQMRESSKSDVTGGFLQKHRMSEAV